ncbi:MAG: hypothetical protein JSV32_07505 [Dehalococcoidia bacterium]|nr:MAG: hypothetical protein JSV32_07505 [Dehalococcoidia bacterium]
MLTEVISYLHQIKSSLRLDPTTENQIIGELYTHFQEKIAEQQRSGINEKEASLDAIKSFGRAKTIARLLYEAHSKGSWMDALMTGLPHLIVALLFASHLWHHYIIAPLVFVLIVSVTLFGWRRDKPCWLYSWIGYSLFPLLLIGFVSRSIPGQAISFLFWGEGALPSLWLLLLVIGSYILYTWIIIRITIRVVKRDWILASLMLIPLPILGCWLYNVEQAGSVFITSGLIVHQWDGIMAFALLILGIISLVFIRLRQRIIKFLALAIFSSITFTIVAHNLWGDIGFLSVMAFAVLMLLYLFIPALVESRVGHGEKGGGKWWQDIQIDYPST